MAVDAPASASEPVRSPATTVEAPAHAAAGAQRSAAEVIDGFFRALAAGQSSRARASFDQNMRQALSEEKLVEVWRGQTSALGALKTIEPDAGVERRGKLVHSVDLAFERGSLIATVALDVPSHELAGLFLRPGRTQGVSAPYVNPAAFRAEEVSFGKEPFVLSGTLTIPLGAGPFPGVVLVHGSGPMDRDETVLANKPFKDIAEGLASHDVAVLRYDKRTFAHANLVGPRISIDDEVVLDATHALDALRARREIDPRRLFVVGHSLGALLAPEIAERAPPVAGVALLAPPGRPPWDMLIEQMRYLGVPPDALAATERNAAEVKKGSAGAQLLGVPGEYWRDLAARDGVRRSRRLKAPILVLRGERDYQVTEADIAIWRSGIGDRANVAIESLPADNHLFVSGSGKPGPAEYAKPGHVDPAVIERLAALIQSSASAKPQ
jgi:dienelactone hydrolase